MTWQQTANETSLKSHVAPTTLLSLHLSISPSQQKTGRTITSQAMALHTASRLHTTTTAMSVTSPPSPLKPTGNARLRLPSDRFALKSSYLSPSLHLLLPSHLSGAPATAPKFSMRVASKQAYICRDCGYIYNDRTPFEKLPDNYFCPVCGAPKRRFRTYEPKVTKDANQTDLRKARKAELQRDEAIGKALPIAIGVGVVALAGLYYYLNNTF